MNPGDWTYEDIIALASIRNISSATLRAAVENSVSLENLFSSAKLLAQCKIKTENLFGASRVSELRELAEKQIEICNKFKGKIITFWDDTYPMRLQEIAYPPALLYVRGTIEPDETPVIGMVGTRKCTHYGQLTAERFASEIAKEGVVVCSGLASGIDSYAHKAAIKAGGKTYAVVASGIDRISPIISAKLAAEISENGAVISEYRFGTSALPAYFPQRNRIISGLSQAVVVVESALSGGALITAQFCFDQNRDLFAVPGNISSEKSAGANMLIRKNMAMVALSAEDVLREIGVKVTAKQETYPLNFAHSAEKSIFESLNFEPRQIDEIAAELSLPPQEIMSNLLMLEFKGMVRQLPGKSFVKT